MSVDGSPCSWWAKYAVLIENQAIAKRSTDQQGDICWCDFARNGFAIDLGDAWDRAVKVVSMIRLGMRTLHCNGCQKNGRKQSHSAPPAILKNDPQCTLFHWFANQIYDECLQVTIWEQVHSR